MNVGIIPIQFGKNQEESKATVGVFDNEMEPVWQKTFTLPYSEKLYDPASVGPRQ